MKKLISFILIFSFVLSSFATQITAKKISSKSDSEAIKILCGLSNEEIINLLIEADSLNDLDLRNRIFFLTKIAISQKDLNELKDLLSQISLTFKNSNSFIEDFSSFNSVFGFDQLADLQFEDIEPIKNKPISADAKI